MGTECSVVLPQSNVKPSTIKCTVVHVLQLEKHEIPSVYKLLILQVPTIKS